VFGNRTFGGQYWAQSSLFRRIIPPITGAFGHGGGGFSPEWVNRMLDQIAERGIGSLDDDDVIALMMLGLV
jgi:hypothetical protein